MAVSMRTCEVNRTFWTYTDIEKAHDWVSRYVRNPSPLALFEVGAANPDSMYFMRDIVAHLEQNHAATLTEAEVKGGLSRFSKWIQAELNRPKVPVTGIGRSVTAWPIALGKYGGLTSYVMPLPIARWWQTACG